MACLDAETIAAWFDRDVPPETSAAVEAHLEECSDCRALVIELARDLDPQAPDTGNARPPFTVGARVGRYVILDWLGAGGLGVVYSAYDPELDRRVAIKILRAEDDTPGPAALLREAQAAARVSHPNVIAVHDAGTHEGQIFVAMELVHGQTLAQSVRDRSLAKRVILARFVDAGRGLAAIHRANLVHGDFKPSNVLVDGDGRVRVTDFGLAHGTPRYMSPEQRDGGRVDASSDQYSFCVSLHEALGGELPPPLGPPPPAIRGVPSHVRSAVARGLSRDPNERFASMDALLAVLTRGRRAAGLQATVAAACVAFVTLAVLVYARGHAASNPCAGADRKLAGVWDTARKHAMDSAFAATGVPYADQADREVERELDDYAARWTAMRTEACAATMVRGEQSPELMDLRMACLDGRARELEALTATLVSADAKGVERSVEAVNALPSLAVCADADALRALVRPPADPATAAEVDRIREDLDRAKARARDGRYADADASLQPLLGRARATRYGPIEAEVDLAVGEIRSQLGDLSAGDSALFDAVQTAEIARDDDVKARALVQLTMNLGDKESKYDEAARLGGLAGAVLTRMPSEVDLQASLEEALSGVDDGRGRYAEGLARGERALAMREAAFGPDDVRVAHSINGCARHLFFMGRMREALEQQQRAVAVFERALGAHHPQVARVLRNVALSEIALKSFDDAIRDADRALGIWRDAFGADHPDTPGFEGVIVEALLYSGRPAEALPHAERIVALQARLHGPQVDAVDQLNSLGLVYVRLGRFDDALDVLARARAACERLDNPPFETATTLQFLGEAYLGKRKPREAIPLFELALSKRRSTSANAADVADAAALLARALWDAGADRRRAITLAEEARDAYGADPAYTAERADVERWLASHGGG